MTDPSQIASASEIRRLNYEKIYSYIYENKRTSKRALALALDLSLPTITQNLRELEAAGLIQKDGFYKSTGGRKAQMISCVHDTRISVGITILKDNIHICAIDIYANLIAEEEHSIPFANDDSYYHSVGDWVNRFASALPHRREQILGVGIAIQGLVSPDGNAVTYGTILNNTGTTREMFRQYLDYPCILIHDTEASASAELHYNKELKDAFFLVLNKNLGGVLIINRESYRGVLRAGGIIEHTTIHPGGELCYCGKRGCMEAYCSAGSLVQRSGLPLELFFQLMRANDTHCAKIWEDYLRNLALSINNMRMVADCPFILSGFLLPYLLDEDFTRLGAYVQEVSALPDMNVEIIRGCILQHSSSIGAALHYIKNFLRDLPLDEPM